MYGAQPWGTPMRNTPINPSAMTDAELEAEIEWEYLLKEYEIGED